MRRAVAGGKKITAKIPGCGIFAVTGKTITIC
jgi:hypothetical protein